MGRGGGVFLVIFLIAVGRGGGVFLVIFLIAVGRGGGVFLVIFLIAVGRGGGVFLVIFFFKLLWVEVVVCSQPLLLWDVFPLDSSHAKILDSSHAKINTYIMHFWGPVSLFWHSGDVT